MLRGQTKVDERALDEALMAGDGRGKNTMKRPGAATVRRDGTGGGRGGVDEFGNPNVQVHHLPHSLPPSRHFAHHAGFLSATRHVQGNMYGGMAPIDDDDEEEDDDDDLGTRAAPTQCHGGGTRAQGLALWQRAHSPPRALWPSLRDGTHHHRVLSLSLSLSLSRSLSLLTTASPHHRVPSSPHPPRPPSLASRVAGDDDDDDLDGEDDEMEGEEDSDGQVEFTHQDDDELSDEGDDTGDFGDGGEEDDDF